MSHAENMPFRMAHVIRRGILFEGRPEAGCMLACISWLLSTAHHRVRRTRDKGDLKNGRNTAMMQNGMFEKVNNVTGDRRCGSLRESI